MSSYSIIFLNFKKIGNRKTSCITLNFQEQFLTWASRKLGPIPLHLPSLLRTIKPVRGALSGMYNYVCCFQLLKFNSTKTIWKTWVPVKEKASICVWLTFEFPLVHLQQKKIMWFTVHFQKLTQGSTHTQGFPSLWLSIREVLIIKDSSVPELRSTFCKEFIRFNYLCILSSISLLILSFFLI